MEVEEEEEMSKGGGKEELEGEERSWKRRKEEGK